MPEDSVDGPVAPPIAATPPSRSNRAVTPAVAGSLVVLAASFALSVAFVLANGGLDLPAAAHGPGSSGSPDAGGLTATAGPTAGTPIASVSAAPSLAPKPSATAPPSPTTAPRPTAAPTGSASSNRYDLLTACPVTPDCWVYVVRVGDNLFSIAHYFGVPLNVVEQRNPWTATTQLVAGQKLLLPAPTR